MFSLSRNFIIFFAKSVSRTTPRRATRSDTPASRLCRTPRTPWSGSARHLVWYFTVLFGGFHENPRIIFKVFWFCLCESVAYLIPVWEKDQAQGAGERRCPTRACKQWLPAGWRVPRLNESVHVLHPHRPIIPLVIIYIGVGMFGCTVVVEIFIDFPPSNRIAICNFFSWPGPSCGIHCPEQSGPSLTLSVGQQPSSPREAPRQQVGGIFVVFLSPSLEIVSWSLWPTRTTTTRRAGDILFLFPKEVCRFFIFILPVMQWVSSWKKPTEMKCRWMVSVYFCWEFQFCGPEPWPYLFNLFSIWKTVKGHWRWFLM